MALIVVLGHYALYVRNLHFFGGGYLNPLSAVFGFFTLSGYSIAASLERNAVGFYKRRFIRIWPLFLLAIAYGLALYTFIPPGFVWPLGEGLSLDKYSIIFSLLMLQGIIGGAIPIIGIIWSLSAEWWLYMAAPFLKNRNSIVLLFLVLLSFIYYMHAHTPNPSFAAVSGWSEAAHGRVIAGLSWIWVSGFLYHRYKRTPIGFLLLMAPALFATSTGHSTGVPFFVSAFALIICEDIYVPIAFTKFLNFLGDLSYPIYLFHFPTMAALLAVGVSSLLPVLAGIIIISTIALCLVDYPARRFLSGEKSSLILNPEAH